MNATLSRITQHGLMISHMQKFTKRILLVSVVGGVAIVTFFFKARIFSRLLEHSTPDEVLFHVETTEKVVALTIDDGPHAQLTPEILDALAVYGVPATFFIIGGRVPGNEALLERIVQEGHELGNHLMSDERSISLNAAEFEQQLAETHALISAYGPVRWFRPGSGFYNERMLAQVRPFQYRTVVGSIYPYDAHVHSVEFASSYILGNVQPGSIVILHDGGMEREATPDILQRIIPALQKRGYRFTTLSELSGAISK